jgi:hypothetical protein
MGTAPKGKPYPWQAGPFEHEEAEQMATPGRAALAGIQETGLDLWQVPRQDSARNTYGLRTWSGPESNSLPPQIDSKQLDPFASRATN